MPALAVAQMALCLMSGPGLVLVWANEAWEKRAGMKAPLGVPIEEVFTDPKWIPVRGVMRDVMETGLERVIDIDTGMVTVIPWLFPDGACGVVTKFVPLPVGSRVRRASAHPQPAAGR